MAARRRQTSLDGLNLHPDGKKVDRSQFFAQLKDPKVMRAFAGRLDSEVGGCGEAAKIAWVETTFNRAASRKLSLMDAVSNVPGHKYFPTAHPGSSNNQHYHDIIRMVAEQGTNLTRGATGNASESVGVGTETCRFDGERFGIEVPDKRWHSSVFPQFLVDVAQAIYNGAKAIGSAIYNAGKWVVNKIGEAFTPHQQTQRPVDQRATEPVQDRYSGDRRFEPPARQPDTSHRISNITIAKWHVNKPPEYYAGRTDDATPRPTVRPGP